MTEPIPADRLATLENLGWWERLDRDSGVTYLCKLAVPASEVGFDPHHETDVSQDAVDIAGDGVDVTMVGSQEALADRVREYGDAGCDPLLHTLTDYEGPADPLDALDLDPSTVREHLQRAQRNLLTDILDAA